MCGHHIARKEKGGSKHLLIILSEELSLVSVDYFFLTLQIQSNICVKVFWSMFGTKPIQFNLLSFIFSSSRRGACLRNYTKAKTPEVEDEICEALKHAPKRKGGSEYKGSSKIHSLCFDNPSTS